MSSPVHFISGLPRSGSTLLSAVLRQNPRFHAAMTSPVASLWFTLLPEMSQPAQFAGFFDNDRRRAVLRGVFESYYDRPDRREVIFDTNRIWSGKVAMLAELFPASRIICCVRELGWIIDSIERMLRRNPLQISRIFEGMRGDTAYARMEVLMNSEIGMIGAAWGNLRAAWFSEFANRLLVVSYEGFVANPAAAMRGLYDALDEPFFQHDFNQLRYDEAGYDDDLGMPGMHRVAAKVAEQVRVPTIPADIFNKYAGSAFWRARNDRPIVPTTIC